MDQIMEGAKEAQRLALYTFDVLKGEKQLMDPKSAVASGFNSPTDAAALACCCLLTFLVTRLLQATVFSLLGQIVIGGSAKNKMKRTKFCESCRELLFYCVSLTLSWVVFGQESWMYQPDDMWKFDRQWTVPSEFKALYFLEASWYIAGIVSLLMDEKKKDFIEMMCHHAFTILLLVISFHQSHMRVGAVVFVLHNLSDPFLQIAKLAKYARMESLSTVSFVVFMLVFFLSRLVYYPAVIYSCHFRGPGYFFNRPHDGLELLLTGLLTALYPIHLYWFFLIIKVAMKALKGNINDTRSDSDEDDDPTSKKTK
mmetsp:Transcript_16136/g.22293  ORF Transcript_16136/g.22293 Transcript_16136/m.22293 type:complete len:312 (+) Transcript_16136:160-1095(+)